MRSNYRKSSIVLYIAVLVEMWLMPISGLMRGVPFTYLSKASIYFYSNFWLFPGSSEFKYKMIIGILFVLTIEGGIALILDSRKLNITVNILEVVVVGAVILITGYENTVSVFNYDWGLVLLLLVFQFYRLVFKREIVKDESSKLDVATQGLEAEILAGKEKAEEEARKQAKIEAERKAAEEERKRAEEEARKRAKIEAERRAAEEERKRAEEEARKRAKIEAERKAAEENRKKAEEEARKQAKIEAERKAAEEERKKAEEEARKQAKIEAEKKAAAEKNDACVASTGILDKATVGRGKVEGSSVLASAGWVVEGDKVVAYRGSDKRIAIPDGVRVIGKNAFAGSSVESISMPDTIIKIEQNAFSGCKMLSTVKWSANLQTIGEGAFEFCKRISSIVLPKANVIGSIGQRAFAHCYSLKTVEMAVTSIGASSFEKCLQLETVTILSKLPCIEANTFRDCIALQNFVIEEMPANVHDDAFANCVAYGVLDTVEESIAEEIPVTSTSHSDVSDYATQLANGEVVSKPVETVEDVVMQKTETHLKIAVRNNVLWDIVSSNRNYGMVDGIEICDNDTYFMIIVGEGVHEVVPKTITEAHRGIIRYLSQLVSDKSTLDRSDKKILDNYDFIQWCDEEIKADDDEEEAKSTILNCFNGLAGYSEGDEDTVWTYYGNTRAELGIYVKSADLWNKLAGLDFSKYGIKVDISSLSKSGKTLYVTSYKNGWTILAEKIDEFAKELSAILAKNDNKSIFFVIQQPEFGGIKYTFDFGEGVRDVSFGGEDMDKVLDIDEFLEEHANLSDMNATIKELSSGFLNPTFTEEEWDNMKAFGIDVDAIQEELMSDSRAMLDSMQDMLESMTSLFGGLDDDEETDEE